MLDSHEHGATPFTTDSKALREPHKHEQCRGPDSNTRVSGEQADQKCCDSHDEEGEDEHRPSSDPVAEMAADNSAEGARGEAGGECAVNCQGSCEGIEVREEKTAEDECAGSPI